MFSSASESEISASTQMKLSVPCRTASEPARVIPTGLEISFRPSPVTSLPSDAPISFVTRPVTRTACHADSPRPRPSPASAKPIR